MLTIPPILGAAMIVAARQGAGEGSLLGLSPVQRIGDWSYSIYLWHWPIWVFALSWLAVRGYDVGSAQKIVMVLVSLALGALSYRFVEQPVRTQRDFWTSAPAADGFQRFVCGVRRLRVAGIPELWLSGQAAGLSAAG